MTFDDILDQVIALLKRQGRVSYRALKRRFDLSDEYIDDLKEEILYVHESEVQADTRGFTWIGDTADIEVTTTSSPDQAEAQSVIEPEHPTRVVAQPVASHPPEAERRQLTILFTDLVDSTKLSGQLDAEEYREIVRAYQTACSEVIVRFECNLAQTLGDGLLIYSGYPVAHENDAERAVRAGLGILAAMKALNERLEQERGIQLAVRVGLHTGTVVVGDVGAGSKQEQLALGEVPNVGARIQGLAEPDTVVISDATYRLVEGYFDCESLGEQTLRGVDDPIAVYRVLGESGAQNRLDVASTRGLTPLVGRESEVTLLLERWGQVKDGQGQVILLSGEGGIGKSRLVQVLEDHVASENHIRLECRSSPYYQSTALYPIIDIIQRTLQWQQDDTPAQRLEKLEQNLSQYRLPLEESVPLFAPLLSLSIPEGRYPALNLSPQRQRQQTLESIVAILLELAEQQPVLFVLEDLHWTDPTTLALLDLLIDQIPTASIYTLLTCRPAFQPTWSHRSYLTEVTVQRLPQHQSARMAAQVAGGKRLPTEVLQHIVAKTDGVPLFVEEMTKAVVESGTLHEGDGQYELAGSVTALAIPATLHDSLMARLDRLVSAKGIAQLGAVIGRQFSYQLLQVVSQLDEATLQRELGRLGEAELVYQRGVPPQASYTFKHALIRDAAYQALLKRTRQHYHQRIAQVLVERFAETVETQPELVAYHYTEAGLRTHAVPYWQQAGKRAIEHSANVEAVNHLTKALEILRTLRDTPESTHHELDVLLSLLYALIAIKGYAAPDVESICARAIELCQHLGHTPQLFRVLRGITAFHTIRAELQTALNLSDRCLLLAQRLQDPICLQQTYQLRGHILWIQGELLRAKDDLEQAVALYAPQQHHIHVGRGQQNSGVTCRSYLAGVLWQLGYPDQALARINEAMDLAQTLEHPLTLAHTLSLAASHHCRRREMREAQERAEAVITLAAEQGFAFWLAYGTFQRGWALAMQGQGDAGIAQMHEGLTAYQITGAQIGVPDLLGMLALAYGYLGHPLEGFRLLTKALALADKTGNGFCRPGHCLLKGELLLALSTDNQTEAEACFHQSLAIARLQEAKFPELQAATSLARLWQSQGKRQAAHELLAPVYEWFTEGFDTADVQEAKALLYELG